MKGLKEERDGLQRNHETFNSQVLKLEECIYDQIKIEKIIKTSFGLMQDTKVIIDTKAIRGCFEPSKMILHSISAQKHVLPKEENSGNTGEKIGVYESNFGLYATREKIKTLEKEGNLDVKSDIRTTNNLNRVRNQVISLKKEINESVDKFNNPKELITCLEGATNFVHISPPDAQVAQGAFFRCFSQYGHAQYKGTNIHSSFKIE